MVPVAILLGPMVMTFAWLTERVDPASWNAEPTGGTIAIVATVNSEWAGPVVLTAPEPLALDEQTPASRTLPPIRATLERLLTLYRQPRHDPAEPWELKAAPDLTREQTAADLQAYLEAGVPPRGISWLIHPPADASFRLPISVTAGNSSALTADVTIGDIEAPSESTVAGPAHSVLKELKIVYPKPAEPRIFFRPFHGLRGHANPWITSHVAEMEVGWVWVYIFAYVPSLLLGRMLLRVA